MLLKLVDKKLFSSVLSNRMTKFRRLLEGSLNQCDTVQSTNFTTSPEGNVANNLKNSIEMESRSLLAVLTEACKCVKEEQVIALPTDTIYGVAGLAQSTVAVNKIYEIKKRDMKNPIAICVGDVDEVYRWGKVTVSKELLQELLPGPVTVIFERTPELNPDLNPGTSLIGIRVPNYTFVLELCKLVIEPLTLTSANVSTEPSALCIQEFEKLWPQLGLVVDGGKLEETEISRQGSTVIDLSKPNKFTMIRPGSAYKRTKQMLLKYGLQEEAKS